MIMERSSAFKRKTLYAEDALPEPDLWHHDILRTDGSAFDENAVAAERIYIDPIGQKYDPFSYTDVFNAKHCGLALYAFRKRVAG